MINSVRLNDILISAFKKLGVLIHFIKNLLFSLEHYYKINLHGIPDSPYLPHER